MNQQHLQRDAQPPQFDLFTIEQATAYPGAKPYSFEIWRYVSRYGPPYLKVGRLIRYRQSDLDTFLERNVRVGHAA